MLQILSIKLSNHYETDFKKQSDVDDIAGPFWKVN